MAAGMVNISGGGGESSCRYIMRSHEAIAFWSNMGEGRNNILGAVRSYCAMETKGNRELGIRGRHDAKLMTKLIVSLPNANTMEENRGLLKQLLEKAGISAYPHLVAMHRGEKDGITNRHAHINFFERKFERGNSMKNRAFNDKHFVEDVTREYQTLFGLSPNDWIRDRIGRINYQGAQRLGKEIAQLEKELKHERQLERRRSVAASLEGDAAAVTNNTGTVAGGQRTGSGPAVGGGPKGPTDSPLGPTGPVPGNEENKPVPEGPVGIRNPLGGERLPEEKAERKRGLGPRR